MSLFYEQQMMAYVDEMLNKKVGLFGDKMLYNLYYNATNFRVKVSRCKRCGNVFAYKIVSKKYKFNHSICIDCAKALAGKNRRENQQKKLKEKIGQKYLDIFFNDFYQYILKECERIGQNWQDYFHKYLLNIVWRLKDSGILDRGNKIEAIKMARYYLHKANKQKRTEKNFSDLSFGFHRRLGLNFEEE